MIVYQTRIILASLVRWRLISLLIWLSASACTSNSFLFCLSNILIALACISFLFFFNLIMNFAQTYFTESRHRCNLFFETIIKSSLPNIYNFFHSTSNKIITFSTKLCNIGRILNCILKPIHLSVPYFSYSILWWTNYMTSMRMKIYCLDCSFMPFIHLNYLISSRIIYFYFAIMWARGSYIT